MRAFDDPAAGFEARDCLAFDFFCTTGFYMRLIMPTLKKLSDSFGVVAFVKADVLVASRWLMTMDLAPVQSWL